MTNSIKLSLLIPFLYLITSNVTNAKSYEFVNADGSNKTDVCIASTVSQIEWEKKASGLAINKSEQKSFTCNGFPIEEFGKKYRNKAQSDDIIGPVKVFSFSPETKKIAAKLCVAAVLSNKKLFQTKREVGVAKNNLYLVRCNGMTLEKFAKRYGNKNFRV